MKKLICQGGFVWILLLASTLTLTASKLTASEPPTVHAGGERPNIVFILTDDQRWDTISASGNDRISTPNLDSICASGTRFKNAFVTLAICSPSRAACLTGRYGSVNGVTAVGKSPLREGERTFAHALREAGYVTGVTGKWHLKTSPKECGFEFASTCWSNGTWYDRKFTIDDKTQSMPGFVDQVTANESVRFINLAAKKGKPFVLWLNTQVPHMDHRHTWPASNDYLEKHDPREMPLPTTWNDDLTGKPSYLTSGRNRTQALKYGYNDPKRIRKHVRDYYASVEQMDQAIGRVLNEIDRLSIRDNTWIIFMGDNGWFLGEHGMTSKVLAYEESMRVPMAIAGPNTKPQVVDDLVLNIDLTATIYQLAGLPVEKSHHGRSLLPIVNGNKPDDWRKSFLYEAPTPQLGSQPLWAVRNSKWKYIWTDVPDGEPFDELYDLETDAIEQTNVANDQSNAHIVDRLKRELVRHQKAIGVDTKQTASNQQQAAKPCRKNPQSSHLAQIFLLAASTRI